MFALELSPLTPTPTLPREVETLQAEVQHNRVEAAELMKAVSAEALNAELLSLIENGKLLPVDEAFNRGLARPETPPAKQGHGHPLLGGLQVSPSRPNTPQVPGAGNVFLSPTSSHVWSRPNTPARPTSALL